MGEAYDEWTEYEEFWPDETETPRRTRLVRGAFRWGAAASGGLVDVRFERNATKDLLPILYVVTLLGGAVLVPVMLVVAAFSHSATVGVIMVVAAPVLGLTIAAAIRLLFELVLSIARLAGRVVYLTEIANDIHGTMTDLSGPMHQMSADLRSVQFWRFRDRRQAVQQRTARR